MKKTPTYNVIGKAELRNDGAEKVTGKAIYTVDVDLPGMAHGKILRSPYAHARLLRVDGSKAEQLPGVFAVVTREDQKSLRMFGAAYKDQTIVAVDKVRYAGDPVAAVAAVDEATAAQALELIEVDYEDLPAVTSIDEALADNAPLVHDASASGGELMGQRYEAPKEFSGTNLCYRFCYANGDVDAEHLALAGVGPPISPETASRSGPALRSRSRCANIWPIFFIYRKARFASSCLMSAAATAASSPSRRSRWPRCYPGRPSGRCVWPTPSKRVLGP